jgi:hypothetical protein
VKLLWEGAQGLANWGNSKWVAAAIAGIIGLIQLLATLGHPDSNLNWSDYPVAVLIAFVNTLVLWFGALGVGEAKDAVT